MNKKELKKSNGDIFFEAQRKGKNTYISVNWIGIQSVETIMMGANLLLSMLREDPCSAILNSNRELIGPWDDGALFLGTKWAPKAQQLGLLYFAQVLGPGLYGKRSFEYFQKIAYNNFLIETFNSEDEAILWLMPDRLLK